MGILNVRFLAGNQVIQVKRGATGLKYDKSFAADVVRENCESGGLLAQPVQLCIEGLYHVFGCRAPVLGLQTSYCFCRRCQPRLNTGSCWFF